VRQLSDALAQARQQRFVGRRAELELFRAALTAERAPFAALYIDGPGGVGKTTLLHELARLAAAHGRAVVHIDGRNLEASPAAFETALRRAAQAPDGPAALPPGAVLLIDTYERLASLDAWLRGALLPQLPADALIVIAGRLPPTAWLSDAGWAALSRRLPLGNPGAEESLAYLAARGVPAERHAAALSFTHGHPLALSLLADLYTQSAAAPAPLASEQEILPILLERFLQDAPTPRHREALELCAIARTTTETLLAQQFDEGLAFELFQWLRQLSFVEQGPYGLFPHDLVRELLDADLHWRNPTRYAELQQVALRYLRRRQDLAEGLEQQRLRLEIMFINRRAPGMRQFFVWDVADSAYAEPATPADFPAILAMVRRHEGPESEAIARHWQLRQPEGFLAYRRAGGGLYGFLLQLALHRATAEDAAIDLAVAAALRYVEAQQPPQQGEAMAYMRFWMAQESYQAISQATNLSAASCVTHWTTTPRLLWSFVAMANPDFMAPHFESIRVPRTPAADFMVGGRSYGVFSHNWALDPVATWLMDTKHAEAALPAPAPALALSERDFAAAVRQALRDYTRLDLLAASPLLQLTLLADGERSPAALQALLRQGVTSLNLNPKDARLYRALWHTYIEPEATQERAAERLNLPFNTYRYHLAGGLERLSAWLWRHAHQEGP
jgi:hypothetical protein